jgi:hypothetical protein
MNTKTLIAICFGIALLSTSCVRTSSLITYYTRNDNIDENNNVVFIKSDGKCAQNLKLVQLLENEKNAINLDYKNNLQIINIIEQREVEKFLTFEISEEICYTYDVVLVGDKIEAINNKIVFSETKTSTANTIPETNVSIDTLKTDSNRINKIGFTKVANYFDADFEVAETPGSKLPSVKEFMKGITSNWFAVDWNTNYLTSELDDIGNPIIIKVINFEFDPGQEVNKDNFITKSGNKKRLYHYFLIEDKK